MRDVRGMAGRGWNGWQWGLGKDIAGFAAFFAIFDVSRRCARATSDWVQDFNSQERSSSEPLRVTRFVHGVVLVSGGVIAGITYEFISIPLDNLRHILRTSHIPKVSGLGALHHATEHVRMNGIRSLFRRIGSTAGDFAKHSRSEVFLRALARVGPYGFAFLVWESFGPGDI